MNSDCNQVESRDSKKESGLHISKLVAIILFLAIDLGLNSVLDYGSFNDEVQKTYIMPSLPVLIIYLTCAYDFSS